MKEGQKFPRYQENGYCPCCNDRYCMAGIQPDQIESYKSIYWVPTLLETAMKLLRNEAIKQKVGHFGISFIDTPLGDVLRIVDTSTKYPFPFVEYLITNKFSNFDADLAFFYIQSAIDCFNFIKVRSRLPPP